MSGSVIAPVAFSGLLCFSTEGDWLGAIAFWAH